MHHAKKTIIYLYVLCKILKGREFGYSISTKKSLNPRIGMKSSHPFTEKIFLRVC